MSDAPQEEFAPRKAFAIVILAPLCAFLLASEHQAVLAVFFTTLALWFTEALPLPVTALLVPLSIALFGLQPAGQVFGPFGNDILFLFLGCFLMSISMAKHGFDRRLAYWLLGHCLPGDSLIAVNIVIAGASFLLSMWISNTAATAIMCAVTIGILDSLRERIADEQVMRAASVRLLLSCAFAASIGGLATPIGSPPNLIAIKYLADSGIEISFLRWMLFGLPLSILMLGVLFTIFEWRYPMRGVRVEGARSHFAASLRTLGQMSQGEKQIAAVFLLAIFFWIMPEVLKTIFPEVAWIKAVASRLSMSVVGLLGGISLFFLPLRDESQRLVSNLEWRETRDVDWGTILLFGGGLALGNLLQESGAATQLGTMVFGGKSISLAIRVGAVIVVSLLLSEFASNTASAAILVPLVLGTAKAANASAPAIEALVLGVCFAASFGFMLPVSTPPNAIVYGTGRIQSRDMIRTGLLFDICGALIIAGFMAVVLSGLV